MIDVSNKSNTLRYAIAEGKLYVSNGTLDIVRQNKVPKGDVFQVARAAGITAAKRTAENIVFCHVIPIDWVGINFDIRDDHIYVTCEAKTVWKTGIEVEAVNGVTAALLNMYDMLKPLDSNIRLTDIGLIKKKGGKSSFIDKFENPVKTAVLVISDSTFAGTREDKSGKIIVEFLKGHQVDNKIYEILPDNEDLIANRLKELVDNEGIELIFTSGGTGFGPKDMTPEATRRIIEKEAPGIAEAIRKHGKDRTPYAMLSREVCGMYKKSIIINLPGSSKGAKESIEAIFPGILHIFPMINGGGH